MFALHPFLLLLGACESGEDGEWIAVDNRSSARVLLVTETAGDATASLQASIACAQGAEGGASVQVEAGVLVVNEAGASSRCEVVVAGADIAEIYVSGDGDVHGEGTFIALERIEVTGRGNVELPVVSSPVLDVRIRGTGNVSIGWQDSEVAGYDLAGDGSFTAAGRVSEGTLDLSGNGDFHGSELVFDRLDARLSGNGDAELNIAGSANLTVNGAGSVTVWGAGDVYAVTGGSGTVTFAE